MSFIDGIGGAFLFSNDPKALASWYRDVLGVLPNGHDNESGSDYRQFEYRDLNDPSKTKSTTWAILPTQHDISDQPRTGQINYRVSSMAQMIAHLKAKGVVIEKTEDHAYGKFAWVTDPEGNRVELFEEL